MVLIAYREMRRTLSLTRFFVQKKFRFRLEVKSGDHAIYLVLPQEGLLVCYTY
jgi:hypothetical protein